ncbi:MAG: transketolase [Pseudomonadota bacterium]
MLSRRELANAIRALSMDAVEKAQSGHPGMPMGMADIAEVLWNDFLSHNPDDPDWLNRDRFVLSNGHGSMLIYALLHLSGYDLSLDDIENFRQLHSKTPGHPEVDETPGVETTTGPLGQGLANAVGMAIAEKALAQQFNRDDFDVINHYTYVFAGDGCLMEGVSHEAASLAGVLQLGKLIVFWDDNEISIDGKITTWMEYDPATRFQSYGWQVIRGVDGHDADSISQAITQARTEKQKPTLICCRTRIGYGAPNKQNTASAHGSPLGAEEIALARQNLAWEYPPFVIPEPIYQAWNAKAKGQSLQADWQTRFDNYKQQHPQLADELTRRIKGDLPADFNQGVTDMIAAAIKEEKPIATRKMNTKVLDKFGPLLPELLGGSADLSGSNNTLWSEVKQLTADNPGGNYIHYGVREFGMAAIMNGIALHHGFIPYGGTFLVFASYCANALRMSALMKQRVIYVFTHDSIGLGEDGPTHQPVEQLSMLRAIPNFDVWRPCDAVESIIAWEMAIKNQQRPSALCMTRQNLPQQAHGQSQIDTIRRGGYVLYETTQQQPEIIIMASGSEVEIAVEAAKRSDKHVRVVSMPCADLFARQDAAYRESVLPSAVQHRVAIEAAAGDFWYKYVGLHGKVIALDRFGLSAPYQQIYQELGITVENVLVAMTDFN